MPTIELIARVEQLKREREEFRAELQILATNLSSPNASSQIERIVGGKLQVIIDKQKED